MCVAIPAKIVEIENNIGIIDVEGVKKKASLILLEDPEIGDYVIVHSGFAMRKLDEYQAMQALDILRSAVENTGQ
jgi:hydrogenase expression/formation protein HypC